MSSPFLVVGAQGLLGTDLVPAFVAQFGHERVIALGKGELNLLDEAKVTAEIARLKPAWVINCAAYTNVDKAETERELAVQLNTVIPRTLVAACEATGSRLLHFSTDQVFDGKNDKPWLETDPPNPLNTYARTKWAGEKAVLGSRLGLVLRVQWLYGKKKDRFTILRDKETFSAFNDQFGAPTWASHLGMVCTQLVEKDLSGLFQFAYDDFASWAEIYQFVKETMGYRVKLEPVTTKSANLPAERPLYSVMSNQKLVEALGLPGLGSWKLSLATFLSGVRF